MLMNNNMYYEPELYELTDEEYYELLLMEGDISKNDNLAKNDYFCLEEDDFNQCYDERILRSYVEDIDGGDNFADYCEYIFEVYEEENCYEE